MNAINTLEARIIELTQKAARNKQNSEGMSESVDGLVKACNWTRSSLAMSMESIIVREKGKLEKNFSWSYLYKVLLVKEHAPELLERMLLHATQNPRPGAFITQGTK